ncbi:glycosyltransferase [Nocardioides sp. ChNu-153]|uniref:glycosyltransferase family protein n=1 Tax=Nocardioides sp. ChNu-153 TaxID=2779364 RepID=UPI002650077F|nr:glycosyltransferase [Nocardioides sp. ChNu-153]MDN7121067.1 glycosyltransferase [Nocardioides sp. ChNu-153]
MSGAVTGGERPGAGLRVLVATVVHHPGDARIAHREMGALLDAGFEVTYLAPFSGFAVPARPGVTVVDVRRSYGRRRLGALLDARRKIRALAPEHDLVLLHDPELLLVAGAAGRTPVVWDVHEDVPATVEIRTWIPTWLRVPLAGFLRFLLGRAERRHHLLLAEHGYRRLFRGDHPVVPNSTSVPATVPGPDADGPARVVYLGSLTRDRGADEIVALARELADRGRDDVRVEVVGTAHGTVGAALQAAHDAGTLVWHGFVPNDRALPLVQGAVAGLALLHDEANHRVSLPTKNMEYLAHGVPVVATPLPEVEAFLAASGGGVVVPFGAAPTDAVLALADDRERARAMAERGHAYVAAHHNWDRDRAVLVEHLARWAHAGR